MKNFSLSQRDRQVIWHPYSQHGLNRQILPVVKSHGAYLELEDGQKILDAISSWWVNLHGHAHPALVHAAQKQASQLEQVIFAGFTHEPAIELAEALIQYSPLNKARMSKVFYSDNGSTAVEVALKMAYQFHWNQGIRTRKKFLALSQSYHGDTLGAMAVGEPDGFHQLFRSLLPHVDFIELGQLNHLQERLKVNGNQYAAFIFEPLVQGAAGMRSVNIDFLEKAVELCQEKGVLAICDEVFTGFYRTGKCFAFEHTQIVPDLICLSKGITGGFLPLAVTLTSEKVYEAFLSQEIKTAFLHGHSYTANPIACAVALESWKLLWSQECQSRIQEICRITQDRISKMFAHRKIKDARCFGTIGAIEMKLDLNYFSSQAGQTVNLLDAALKKNVLLRPLGNVVYAVPPYCIKNSELHRIYDVMEELADDL